MAVIVLTERSIAHLDRAVTRLADQEFVRLKHRQSPSGVRNRVFGSLDSLRGLGGGKPPDYSDPWVALLYFTWYFPGHVQLASCIADSLLESRQNKDRSLWIVDYGCGNLATLFGVSLACSRRDRPPSRIAVLAIDPSDSMRRLGERLWQDGALADDRISYASRSEDFVERLWNQPTYTTETWFIAMHAIYEENKERLRAVVEEFRNKYSPSEMILTCNKMNEAIARNVVPDAEPLRPLAHQPLPLPRITAWRTSLSDGLGDHPSSYLLKRTVDSGVQSPLVLRRRRAK